MNIKINRPQVMLSQEERSLVPMFIRCLQGHIESKQAIKAKDISASCTLWAAKKGLLIDLRKPKVCKIIRHIRLNNLLPNLVASSKGYYITNDSEELARYIFSLEDRVKAITQVVDVMTDNYVKLTTHSLSASTAD